MKKYSEFLSEAKKTRTAEEEHPLPKTPGTSSVFDTHVGEVRVSKSSNGNYYADHGSHDSMHPNEREMREHLKKHRAVHTGWENND